MKFPTEWKHTKMFQTTRETCCKMLQLVKFCYVDVPSKGSIPKAPRSQFSHRLKRIKTGGGFTQLLKPEIWMVSGDACAFGCVKFPISQVSSTQLQQSNPCVKMWWEATVQKHHQVLRSPARGTQNHGWNCRWPWNKQLLTWTGCGSMTNPFSLRKKHMRTHGLVMHSWNIMKLGIPCEAKCWTHHWGPYQWMIPNSTSLPSPSVLQRLSGVKHEHQYGKGLSNWDPLCGSGHRSIVWCFDLQMALSETWNSGTPRKKPPKNWWLNISVGYTFQDFTINPRRILLEYITIIFRQILISGDIFQ